MNATLRVRDGGPCTTVQDLGRFGYQALGVPVAGALDPFSLRLLNALLGNDVGGAVIEYLYMGPVLEVAASSVRVAASTDILVEGEHKQRTIPAWQTGRLLAGERLRVTPPRDTVGGYLAVAGGIALEPTLGSLSTYMRSRLGGLDGRALRSGDELPLRRDKADNDAEQRLGQAPPFNSGNLARVVTGPQADFFTGGAMSVFLEANWTVSKQADRMGLRLDGPVLEHTHGYDIVSDGIVTGAIQVPGSGQPIVLLADHQTTGGYPKIATVVSSDLAALGRLRPGDRLRFEAVTVEQAETLAAGQAADLARRLQDIVTVATTARLDTGALLANNLISGAVDALE